MNIIWALLIILGLIILLFTNPQIAFLTMMQGSEKTIALTLKLLAIYSLWLGILKIVEASHIDRKLAKMLKPAIKFLIGPTDLETEKQISVNITGNIFGLGSAVTPSGIKAMQGMDKGSKYATSGMIMLLILNTTNLQIIPSTIIGMRVLAGSYNASDIILPTIITSIFGTTVGITLVKACGKIFKNKA